MKLIAPTIELGRDPQCESCFLDLYYSYETETDTHRVSICGCFTDDSYSGTRFEMVNHLVPYRGNPEVDHLIEWLCR